MSHTFEGEEGLRNFLNPFLHAPTPLVELPAVLNPFTHLGIRIHAKMLTMLPLGNVKSLPAFQMLQEMKGDVDRIVESSSGNTVASLAVLARSRGVQKTKAFVSHDVAKGKLRMLQLFGVEVEVREEDICPSPTDPISSINLARKAGKHAHTYNPDQYANEANPKAHYLYTGPQIFQQRGGQISLFVAGLGTTGTITGTGRFLKEQNSCTKVVGVVRSPNNPVPGVRTKALLRHIDFDWKQVVDDTCMVGTYEAFEESLAMIRHGLVVGPSSGFALAGVKKYIHTLLEQDLLHTLPHFDGIRHVVFICCDSPYPYMDEYFQYLSEDHFPLIHNAHLLHQEYSEDTFVPSFNVKEITPEELFKEVFGGKPQHTVLPHGTRIIDVREQREYDESHIPGAERLAYGDMRLYLETYKEEFSQHRIYLVCSFGSKTAALSNWFAEQGLRDISSLQGGMIAWSEKGLPRVKAHACERCQETLTPPTLDFSPLSQDSSPLP